MRSMWQEDARRELRGRLSKLTPESRGRWGRLSAPQMVVHVSDSFRSAFGDLQVQPTNLPLRYPPLKQLVIYWLPFPKNAPTAPELLARQPGEWDSDVGALAALMARFAVEDPGRAWPVNAAFGPLTGRQWGILMYRHADHHLRQFGV